MKSKLFIAAALALALVGGFFLGRFQVTRSLGKDWSSIIYSEPRRAMASFSRSAALLNDLERGDTNQVVQTLEADLDTNVLLLGAAVEELSLSERDKRQCLSRIHWLREHRVAHPWKSGYTGMDAEVAHVLSLVVTNQ